MKKLFSILTFILILTVLATSSSAAPLPEADIISYIMKNLIMIITEKPMRCSNFLVGLRFRRLTKLR